MVLPQGFKALYDPTLAYKFMYPVQGASGKQLTMTLTRPPEKVQQTLFSQSAEVQKSALQHAHMRCSVGSVTWHNCSGAYLKVALGHWQVASLLASQALNVPRQTHAAHTHFSTNQHPTTRTCAQPLR